MKIDSLLEHLNESQDVELNWLLKNQDENNVKAILEKFGKITLRM